MSLDIFIYLNEMYVKVIEPSEMHNFFANETVDLIINFSWNWKG